MTLAEKARLETLAAFGNEGFGSLDIRKDDFRVKLQSSATKTANTTQPRALKRLERAKLEANSAFKNIKLGENTSNSKKRKLQENDTENANPKKANLTRLQKAKVEVDKAFENVTLATIPKKRSKLEQEKIICSKTRKVQRQTENLGTKPLCSNSSTKRITRSQSAKSLKENTQEMPSSNIKVLPTKIEEISSQEDKTTETTSHEDKKPDKDDDMKPKRLTRIERAKVEAIQSFKGENLDEISKESKKIVSKYLKPKIKTDMKFSTTPVTLLHKEKELMTRSASKQGMQTTPVFQVPSFHKRVHSSFSPVPSPNRREEITKPYVNVYSCIHGDENLNDHTVLLETSKRVVETAISLETPEGSPLVLNKQ